MAFQFAINLDENMAGKLRPLVEELTRSVSGLKLLDETVADVDKTLATFSTHIRSSAPIVESKMFDDSAWRATQQEIAEVDDALREFTVSAIGARKVTSSGIFDADPTKVQRLTLEWGNMFSSFAGFRRESGKWIFNVADGLGAMRRGLTFAVDLAGSLVNKLTDVYKSMAEAAGRAQDLRLGLDFAGGGGETTGMAQQLARSFAGTTRISEERAARAFLPFLRAGVRNQQLIDDMGTLGADVEAVTAGEKTFDEVTKALGKIAVKRKAEDDQLEALGLNKGDFDRAVAGRVGKSVEAARKMMTEGKVTSQILLEVARDEMVKKSGRTLGEAALAAGGTMGASIQRLADLPETMLRMTADSPGMKRLQETIDGFVATMTGETGTKIMDRLASALDGFLVQVTPAKLVSAFETLGDALAAALPALEILGDALIRMLGGSEKDLRNQALGTAVDAGGGRTVRLDRRDEISALRRSGLSEMQINDLISMQGEAAAMARAMEQVMREQGGRTGAAGVAGLVEGARAGMSLAEVTGAEVAMSLVDGAAGPDGIDAHSPSRKFRRLGEFSALGLVEGMDAGAGRVRGAAARLAGAALPDPATGIDAHSPSRKTRRLGEWGALDEVEGMDAGAGRLPGAAARLARAALPDPAAGIMRSAIAGGDSFTFGDIIVQGGESNADTGMAVRLELLSVIREARASRAA